MIQSKLYNAIKYIFIALGIIFMINSVFAFVLSNVHTGIVLTVAAGVFFLLCGAFYKSIAKNVDKAVRVVFICLIISAFSFVLLLFIFGKFDSATYNEDAVIVLGAGIRGDAPGKTLEKRLDAAAKYYKVNPNAVIVVSGGQGSDECITEALAMEMYLIDQGIPKSSIIREEKSTSTRENFLYSKEILDNYFSSEYKVVFISSDYHMLRAVREAKRAGFSDVTHYNSCTPFYFVIPNGIREVLAIIKTVVLT